jgi:hypothetical protein
MSLESNRLHLVAYKARHKALGLCLSCSEPAIERTSYCEVHREDNRQRSRRYYESHKNEPELTGIADQVWACARCETQRKYGNGRPDDKWSPKELNCAACLRPTEHWFSHVGPVVDGAGPNRTM